MKGQKTSDRRGDLNKRGEGSDEKEERNNTGEQMKGGGEEEKRKKTIDRGREKREMVR